MAGGKKARRPVGRPMTEATSSRQPPQHPSQPTQHPPRQPSQPQSMQEITGTLEGTSSSRRTRGPTRALDVVGLDSGQKFTVEVNRLMQPIGYNARRLSTYLGTLARDGAILPIMYSDWREIGIEKKEDLWVRTRKYFDIPAKLRKWVILSISSKWRDWKHYIRKHYYEKAATFEERLQLTKGRVDPEQFWMLCDFWDSEEGRTRSATNKRNRLQAKMPHTCGTMSYARRREVERLKDPEQREPNRTDFWVQVHKKKDGQPVDEAALETIAEFEHQTSQLQESSSSIDQDAIFTQVLGPERGGRVRGYGAGITPTDLWGPKPTVAEALREASEAREKTRAIEKKLEEQSQMMDAMKQQLDYLMQQQQHNSVQAGDHCSPERGSVLHSSVGSRDPQICA